MVATLPPDRVTVALPCACTLGEGPVWDERIGTLHWVDIEARAVLSWRPGDGGRPETRTLPEKVGFVLLTDDPAIVVVGLKSGLARLDLGDGELEPLLAPEPDRPENRLNDADVGPDGSVYFGSMNDVERTATGRFHHWTSDGLSTFGEAAIVTNGPALDPERRILYATDTSAGRIYRHPLGPDGTPGPREPFATVPAADGHPDGMAVDADGCLWVCHFGGSRVTRFDPDGDPVLVVPIPTTQVTKMAFGGPDLATAYVTTAARGRDRAADPLAGHLFTFDPGVRGLPARRCRMGPVRA